MPTKGVCFDRERTEQPSVKKNGRFSHFYTQTVPFPAEVGVTNGTSLSSELSVSPLAGGSGDSSVARSHGCPGHTACGNLSLVEGKAEK